MAQNPVTLPEEPFPSDPLETDLPEEGDENLDDDYIEEEEETEDSLQQPLTEASPPADIGALEDLFQEATAGRALRQVKRTRLADPSLREALDATAKKMREVFTNPDNWKQGRGLVLIDKETQTVLGNYHEFLHKTTSARKLLRAHEPIKIDGQEIIEGWLGHEHEQALRGVTWDKEVLVVSHVTLDEIQVDAPKVPLVICLQFNTIIRANLAKDTQFASASGNVLLKLTAGTDIWAATGVDTKAAVRKSVLEAASLEPVL